MMTAREQILTEEVNITTPNAENQLPNWTVSQKGVCLPGFIDTLQAEKRAFEASLSERELAAWLSGDWERYSCAPRWWQWAALLLPVGLFVVLLVLVAMEGGL